MTSIPAVQACEVQPDNTLQLCFAPESDKVCSEISALVILLQPHTASDAAPKRTGCRPSGLSLQTEVHLTIANYQISRTCCDVNNLFQRNCDSISAAQCQLRSQSALMAARKNFSRW